MALPTMPESSPPLSSSSCSSSLNCLPISFSTFFLSCAGIQRRKKNRKKRQADSPNSPSPSTSNSTTKNEKSQLGCSHLPGTACTCTCTYTSPTSTSTTPLPTEKEVEVPNLNAVLIAQTTSIRLVESDTSTRTSSDYDYDSTISRTSESDSDAYSVSDYECHCENVAEQGHTCENDDGDFEEIKIKQVLSSRPLPPLPAHSGSGSRKHTEIKTRLIEETIPEEDEDEYLAQQEQLKEQEEKKHKRSASRRKSMIELLNLSSISSSAHSPSRPTSSSSGLSVSFSNLYLRFPLPLAWTQRNTASTTEKKEEGTDHVQEKRRPMSMSALSFPAAASAPSSGQPDSEPEISRADFLEGFQFPTLPKALTSWSPSPSSSQRHLPLGTMESAPSPTVPVAGPSAMTPSPRTKRERRMGTVLFPPSPLAMLSRSNMALVNRDGNGTEPGTTDSVLTTATGKSNTLFC